MNLENNIWKFYMFYFFKNFNFILPIYFIFLQSNGLSVTQVMTLLGIFSLVCLILEIPSGVFADCFGRKLSIILGILSGAIGYTIIAAGSRFSAFALAYILLGIGMSGISGADIAILYDSMKELKQIDHFKKKAGRAYALMNAGFALGALAGGFILRHNMRLNYIFYAASMLIALFFVISMKEPKLSQRVIEKHLLKHLTESLHFSWENKRVKNLIIYTALIVGSTFMIFSLIQPSMASLGISLNNFGYIYVVLLLTAAIGSVYAHKIEKSLGERISIILIPALVSLPLIIMGSFFLASTILFFIMIEFAYGFAMPVVDDYINRHIPSKKRATVNSIKNMAMRLWWAVGSPLIGLLADSSSLPISFICIGVSLIMVSLLILPVLIRNSA